MMVLSWFIAIDIVFGVNVVSLFWMHCACVVDDGAILDMQFSQFHYGQPDGYEQLMIEKSLL